MFLGHHQRGRPSALARLTLKSTGSPTERGDRAHENAITPGRSGAEGFFGSAAAAERAGFRPCLRCRPETAPGSPAWSGTATTVARGMRFIEEGFLDEASVAALADRLGVGPRHLLRLFLRHTGAPPSEIAATRRVQAAKRLIDQTTLGLSHIAFAAGFRSVRRFNDAFRATYGRPPSSFRRSVQRSRSPDRTQPLYEKALESREWPLEPESELQPSSRA
jgi:AraC family transcriptional regulator of adaptative response/methylated-DNA-[protein]-cysteine methyltransferase